jgi:preprotein translocase subunit SecG
MDSVKAFLHDWRLVLLIIHVGVTAAMIVVILLQRSEGGGLGMSGRTDALFSVRGQANVLSRATAIFAGLFFFLSLLMAWSVGEPGQRASRSIMDNVHTAPVPAAPAPGGGAAAPGTAAPAPGAATPTAPSAPSAPTR